MLSSEFRQAMVALPIGVLGVIWIVSWALSQLRRAIR